MNRFVILYCEKPLSYFRELTETGPVFGSRKVGSPSFKSEEEALQMIRRFPEEHQIKCDIIPLLRSGKRHR